SVIHVHDDRTNRYIPIPAVDQEYTKGLSLWQHKIIKREARTMVKEYVDIEALCLAKDRIQRMVDKGFNAQSKSSSNVKAALWQTLGKAQGRIETSFPAETQTDTRPTSSDARLLPQTESRTDFPNLRTNISTRSVTDPLE